MAKIENLKQLVSETSGASCSISITETGYSLYFLQQKKKFDNSSFEELIQEGGDYISQNREDNPNYGKSTKYKQFKIK